MPTVVVTETISTHYIDASGRTYNVEVSYGPEAGIPSGAQLAVSELVGEATDAYAARAAKVLNVNEDQVAYAKALDITIMADGQRVQPSIPVSVSIKLLDAPEADDNTNIDVIHFGNEPKSVSCVLEGDAVTFEADGFSVYVVMFTRTQAEETTVTKAYTLKAGDTVAIDDLLSELSVSGDIKSVESGNSSVLTVTETEGKWFVACSNVIPTPVALTVTMSDNAIVVIRVTSEEVPLTITADSDTKVYDGTALTKDSYTCTGLAEGDRIESVTVTGSQTVVGSCDNVPSWAKIVNAAGEDVTARYDIIYASGTLEVTAKHLTITADSDSKVYDGTALTNDGYTSTDLAEGDRIESVTVTGTQTDISSSENVPSAAKIVNDGGEDVTSSYEITYANGTLEVAKKAVTITADSAVKVYDGTALTKDSYTSTALAVGDSFE